MSQKNIYLVEGETEERLVNHLVAERLIEPGKRYKFNLWEKDVINILRKFSRKDNVVIIVFDTDIPQQIKRFNQNLKRIVGDSSVKAVILAQQTKNMEEELQYCCSCNLQKLLGEFNATGLNEFKRKFIKASSLTAHFDRLGFDFGKLWSRGVLDLVVLPKKKVSEWSE